MTLKTYYPSISGEYDQVQLLPRQTDLTGSCVIGTLYVNSASYPQYCRSVFGTGTWGSVSQPWTQSVNDIFLTDGITQPALHVGIGTTTPEFKLTLVNDAGILATGIFSSGIILPNGLGAGSRLIWYPRKAAFRAGYVSSTQWDDANMGNYSAALGKNSTASGNYSVVGGGDTNLASGQYSNVIGGQTNTASGDYSAITGGLNNTASGQYTTVTGGQTNLVSANYAAILGGQNNQVLGNYSTIGGGAANRINNIFSRYSNINGGQSNTIQQYSASVTIGYATIGGGLNNSNSEYASVISGGNSNGITAKYSGIGGGENNTINFTAANNIPRLGYARISGGETNAAIGQFSSILGGQNHNANNDYSTIGGGISNTTNGDYSTLAGGERNTASGAYSLGLGGTDNIAGGDYSWVEGKNMRLTAAAARAFAWGYSDTPISITSPDAFIIAPGTLSGNPWNPKVGIRDINPVGALEINGNSTTDDYLNIKRASSGDVLLLTNSGYIGIGRPTPANNTYALQVGTNGSNGNGAYVGASGVWWQPSSRMLKNHIQPLSSSDAEQTLDQLHPVTFHYKNTPDQTNVGFIAEDVPDLVAMKNRSSLNALDFIALLTKVAQNQQTQINKQDQRIKNIKKEINDLKQLLGE